MNATPSRLGQANGTGQADALFLQLFGGEVMTAFDTNNVMLGRTMVRTITQGKAASFPATGLADAYDHTPGTRLVGRVINHNERVITIDGLVVSDVFIANIDDAMNHFDVRSIYTQEVGRGLARRIDRNILQISVLAARATTTITGGFGGSALNGGTNAITNASGALRDLFYTAAQTLDEKNVPEEMRSGVLRPAQYYRLALDTTLSNRDFSANPGADYTAAKVMNVAGIEIVKSNNLPITNITTGNTKYQGNFAATLGVVMIPGAIGTLKLMDIATEGEYMLDLQGTMIVSKYAMGHGILRPEGAVELRSAP